MTKFTNCPRCGGAWTRRSNLITCLKCNHQPGSQNPHRMTADPVDDEEKIDPAPGRARELKFRKD